jgi:hypothetical protein
MLPMLLALLLQSSTISGTLLSPPGSSAPQSAQVVLLPSDYANLFNAEAQRRIDRYWDTYKPEFAERKETFSRAFAAAYMEAIDIVVSRMRSDGKTNGASLIRTATGGQFEFRGVPPGDYKIVATGSVQAVNYVWTESVQITSGTMFLQMKNRVP